MFFWVQLSAPFEYEIVVVVSNDANINSASELRGSEFCHPGHGLQESHLTEVLANVSTPANIHRKWRVNNGNQNQFFSQYFESTLVARQCEADMSLAESRIKASADFFGPSCKAGPWVPDVEQDRELSECSPAALV